MYFQLSIRDVAQMVERSLCMREVRGSFPRIYNFNKLDMEKVKTL